MQKINNIEIRQEIERRRLKYYEVADAIGINRCTFSVMLRKELPEDKKHEVLDAIAKIE